MADTVEGLVKRLRAEPSAFIHKFPDDLHREAATALEALVVERDETLTYATNFLVSFVNRYCDPVEGWSPLPDLLGVLTQLDNASTIAAVFLRRADAAEARALAAEAQRDEALLAASVNEGFAHELDDKLSVALEALKPFAEASDELPDHIHDMVPVVLTIDENDDPATIVHIEDFRRARSTLNEIAP